MRPFLFPDRNQTTLMPPAIEDWLPEKHLARFVVEICDQLDLTNIYKKYGHTGSKPYDPHMMMALTFYGYINGIFSSRKLEAATYDSVAFRFITGNLHPDHSSIASFRTRFLPLIDQCFVQILLIGQQMGLVKMGNVYIDGTKVKANASKHKAMSYEYMDKVEKQLMEEVQKLLDMAEKTDREEEPEVDLPEELVRRNTRLAKIRKGKRVVEERAKKRYEDEKEAYDAKMAERKRKEKERGRKLGGKKPKPPEPGPKPKDQYNFTDGDSRIMKTKGGFDQCFNAQATVNEDMVILGGHANNSPNDIHELIPALEDVPEELGKVDNAGADTGYCSRPNIEACEARGTEPFLPTARQPHNRSLEERLAMEREPDEIPPRKEDEDVLRHMDRKLKSKQGRGIYRLRKMTVEPVFGIIKEVMGFRRFSLRGEAAIDGEWGLLCSAYNLKRFFKMLNA